MCGRYNLIAELDEMVDVFDAELAGDLPRRIHRYNIAPSQRVPIVRQDGARRVLDEAQWGFIPSWADDPEQLKSKPINARVERADKSPMFRAAWANRRCLIPATGFYEWQQTEGDAPKQPYVIERTDGLLFAFAGLWELWQGDQAETPLRTMTILTTHPNDLMQPIHDRMPVVLPRHRWADWLNPDTADPYKTLSVAAMRDAWHAEPITRRINSPRHDDPSCLQRA